MKLCYILNKTPKSKNTTSQYEVVKNKKPKLSYFKIWGCLAYVRIPYPKRRKLVSGAYECVFIGYAINNKAYKFYDLINEVIIESNDANFFEDGIFFKSINSRNSSSNSLTSGGTSSSSLTLVRNQTSNEEIELESRRSKRSCTIKDFGNDFGTYKVEKDPKA